MTTTTILLTAGLTAALLMTACTQNYGDYFSLRPGLANSSVGIVSNINITSNHVPDISDLDAWKKSYIRPDMTDHEKALACWKTLVAFQHQNPPPSEFLHSPENSALLDPFKMFHVYGYGLCSVHSAHLIAMARTVGLTARGQTVVRHVIPEIFYDNAWHMFDSSLVNYFPKPDGSIASIDEIIAATAEFYKKHPELKGNGKGLDQFRQDGRWKTEGPPLFAANPFYDENGMLDANWPWPCGWMESMHEYDGTTQFIYESGYSMGYRLNIQLRPGEKITRNWHHKGMHINMDNPNPKTRPTCLDLVPGEGPMKFLHKYGNVLAPGRIGNGVHEYNVPLKNIARSALHTENLTNVGNTLQAQDPSKPAILIIRMPSSYVYLAGELNLDVTITPPATVVPHPENNIKVYFSDNNGLDFREIQALFRSGKTTLALNPLIFRRYDYQLKFVLSGKEGGGTTLNAINIRQDIQHSQAPLPALDKGENTITFSSGNEGTITVEGSTKDESKGKQVLASDFHIKKENIGPPTLSIQGKTGWVEFPIATPAAMHRLRIFTFFRARSEGDSWHATVSFDNGKTYRDLGPLTPPYNRALEKKFTVTDIPPNTKSALVRFTGTNKDGALLFNVRLDADYPEPHGGFRPVKITYNWEENGKEKQHTHIARSPNDTWKINCATKPLLKSYTVELE